MSDKIRSNMNMGKKVAPAAPARHLTTTLNEICRHYPYNMNWEPSPTESLTNLLKHLGKSRPDDEPLPLEVILEANGISTALTVLDNIWGYKGAKRLYLCNCARKVLPIYEEAYPGDMRPHQAIETSEGFARGQVTEGECHAAARTAWTAWKDTKSAAGPSSVLSDRWFIAGSTRKTAAHDAAAVAAHAASIVTDKTIALSDAKDAMGRQAAWRKWMAPLRTIAVVSKIPGTVAAGAMGAVSAITGYTLGGVEISTINLLLGYMVLFGFVWFSSMQAIQTLVECSMKATYRAAKAVAEEDFKREFIRLCRLEGEYGEVPE